MNLGTLGFTVNNEPDGSHLSSARELEQLGFRTLWIVGGQLDRLDRLTDLLDATERATVASAIVSPEVFDSETVASFYQQAESVTPGRLLIGLGSPHQPHPLSAVDDYIEQLNGAIPRERRLLAALGPRALDLARHRFAGAIPMLFTPAHTKVARDRLGPNRILAVGLLAVIDANAEAARKAARETLTFLATLQAYRRSFRRQGFRDEEVASLSDSLVDRLIAWGHPTQIVDRAREHLAAGADHVQLTVLGTAGQPTGISAARLLAPAIA
jgi:probable F420-dependent oxidoreductase